MQSFLNPEEILDQLNLKIDMLAAEFGCGSGNFVIALAKRLNQGLVYGLDIREAPLSALKSRALMERASNIQLIRCDLEKPKGSTLPDSSLDLVLIPNVFFQSEDREAIMTEASRVLKNRGKLVIIEWSDQTSYGPSEKISPEEMKELAEKAGFKLEKEIEAGKYHYGLVFEKL
jgi:ubiquinone/menaquinone biosynthesis C-methylase UbiE